MKELEDLTVEARHDSTRWFGDGATVDDLGYHALALCGEAGEFANLVKKIERGTHTDTDLREDLESELVDVLTYVFTLAGILDINLDEAYAEKRKYNDKRFTEARMRREEKGDRL